MQEVGSLDADLAGGVRVDGDLVGGLDEPVERRGLGGSHQTLQLGAAEVFGQLRQLLRRQTGEVKVRRTDARGAATRARDEGVCWIYRVRVTAGDMMNA